MSNSQNKSIKGALEVIGVTAVVLGLVFVGLELRQNTAAVQAATSQGLLEMSNQSNMQLAVDSNYAELIMRADQSLDGLTALERFQYTYYVMGEFNIWEQAFYNHTSGTLNERLWNAYDNSQRVFFCTKSSSVIWGEIEYAFGTEFRAHVNETTPDQCAEIIE